MSTFKFRILDYHEDISFTDEGDMLAIPRLNEGLKSFHFVIDVNEMRINAFRSYTILDSENNPTEVTKVFLSDGSFVFAANKIETFEQNYKEDYLSLFKPAE